MRNINDDIEMTLLSHEQIVDRCKELGKQLSEEYAGKDLILICILKGSVPFLSELIKHITIDVRMEFMCVSSYHGTTHSSGDVKIIKDIDCSLVGKDVVIVEDIVDTGRTIQCLQELLKFRKANSVKIMTLISKKVKRVCDVVVDYVGFEIEDYFIVGFGLDYDENYRHIPYIGVLKKEAIGGV